MTRQLSEKSGMQRFLFVLLVLIPALSRAETLFPMGLVSLGDDTKNLIAVDKSRRILRVYEFNNGHPHQVMEFPSDIGKKEGPKEKANDSRTPTGIYFLMQKMTQPEIPFSVYGSLAFSTDYPNIFDQRDAKGGSGIWLHAVPDTVPLTRGSRGCVVVRNKVIQELGEVIRLKETPLVIFDKIEEVSPEKFDAEKNKYLAFFEEWRHAWETQDVDTYIKFYDPSFRNSEMNFKQWYRHKKRVKNFAKKIEVKLSTPLILHNNNQIVIRTLQEYRSDVHQDYGIKTIHARWSPESGFKIIREDWEPRESAAPLKQATETTKIPTSGLINQDQ